MGRRGDGEIRRRGEETRELTKGALFTPHLSHPSYRLPSTVYRSNFDCTGALVIHQDDAG